MRPAKDLLNKPIYTIDEGRLLGKVQDLYLDGELTALAGIFLGAHGVFKRRADLILREDVIVFGTDAVLVSDADCITDDQSHPEAKTWLLRGKLGERAIGTAGGMKLGKLGDVEIEPTGRVTGLLLSKVLVEGPLAETKRIDRSIVLEPDADGVVTVDLAALEQLTGGAGAEEPDVPVEKGPPPLRVTVDDEPPAAAGG
jgi:sporulation protein YlmC with PRC-barrel domain